MSVFDPTASNERSVRNIGSILQYALSSESN
jgi:hypothetical protein